MNPVTFFRSALLLPVVAPLLALPFDLNAFTGVLLLSLAFGGVQYVLFAVVLFVLVGRARSASRIRRISVAAPVLFVPVQALGWVLYRYFAGADGTNSVWGELLVLSTYTVVIGYVYVGVVNLLYTILSKGRKGAPAV